MTTYNLRSSSAIRSSTRPDDTNKAADSAPHVDDRGKSDSIWMVGKRRREAEGRQMRLERIVASAYPHDSIFTSTSGRDRADGSTYRVEGDSTVGRLEFVMQVPLDIFNEIAGYLSVLDLLNLSYSSWDLHDVLLSKSFRPVWRTAVREIGAPDCPQDVNEPQFAGLLLSSFCQACGDPRVEKINVGLRVRLCARCAPLNLITGGELLDRTPGVSRANVKILRLCFYDGLEFAAATTTKESDKSLSERKYLVPDFEDVACIYMAFKQGSRQQKEFIADRSKLLNDIWNHAKETQSWLSRLDPTRMFSLTRDCLRAHIRKTSILRRLKDIGYSVGDIYDELSGEERVKWKELVLRPFHLTETELADILPEIISLLQMIHRKFVQDLRNVYDEFVDTLEEEEDIPSPIMSFEEAKQLPEVQAIIERRKIDVKVSIGDEERDVIQHLFREANLALGDLIKQTCAAAIRSARETAGLPPLTVAMFDVDEGVLRHASTFFLDADAPFDFELQTYVTLIGGREDGAAWRPLDPQCPKVIKVASALLNALNLPENVDMDRMLDRRQYFICKRCGHHPEWQMNWKQLVHHFVRESKWFGRVSGQLAANPGLKLNIIDSHNTDAFEDLVEMVHTDMPRHYCPDCSGGMYCCNLCRDTVPEYTMEDARMSVEAHIRLSHGIQNPTADHCSRPYR